MSWKANAAGLTAFVLGSLIVTSMYFPQDKLSEMSRQNATSQEAYRQTSLEQQEVKDEVIREIMVEAETEHGITLSLQEANKLNCSTKTRFKTDCFHRELMSVKKDKNYSIMASADGSMNPVKSFGTVTVGDFKYTLKSYTGSGTFHLKKH